MNLPVRLVSWLDILDIEQYSIPYILFRLEKIKKDEAISSYHILHELSRFDSALTRLSLYITNLTFIL